MPGQAATVLADQVHRTWSNVKILLTSGYAEAALKDRKKVGAGANWLQKPYTKTGLAEKVRAVLDGRTT